MPTQPSITWTVDEAQELLKTTAPEYFKGEIDACIRDRPELAFLQKKGRINYNVKSPTHTWDTDYDEPPISTYGSGTEFTFDTYDYWKQSTLDVRGYHATAKVHDADVEKNKGNALVDLMGKQMPKLKDKMRKHMHAELYVDGMSSGNDLRWCGYETWAADDGATVAADIVARPNDTYAGNSTAPGTDSTNWSTALSTKPNATINKDWPEGKGDTAFDWNSPILANWSSTNWGTNSPYWIDNAEILIMRVVRWLKRLGGTRPDMLLCASHLHADYATFQKARYRIIVPHEEFEDMGFGETYKQDGVAIYDSFDCAANLGYFLNFDLMELNCVYEDLWRTEGPWFDRDTDQHRFKVKHMGNLRFTVKGFGKTKNYA